MKEFIFGLYFFIHEDAYDQLLYAFPEQYKVRIAYEGLYWASLDQLPSLA
jgi:hypothetical protein